MKRFQHGGDIYSRKIKYDFSANINPLGMPERVKKGLQEAIDTFQAYPDPNCSRLVAALAKYEGVKKENIVCGNGAADLIYRIVYTVKPKRALLIAPTFSEYEKALRACGTKITFYPLRQEDDFQLSEHILQSLTKEIDLFFICNPNNPVGNTVDKSLMRRIVEQCHEQQIQLVVDECFLDFMEDETQHTTKKYLDKGLIIIKAFTKMYSMAGLRLGYLLCQEGELMDKISESGQAWSVSTPAQVAGELALQETEFCNATRALISKEREYLMMQLQRLGLKVYPSKVNFILFQCNVPLVQSLEVEDAIAIRDCSNYEGLNTSFYRVAVRGHQENEILIGALERKLKYGKSNYDSRNNV